MKRIVYILVIISLFASLVGVAGCEGIKQAISPPEKASPDDIEWLAKVIASEAGSVYDNGNWVRCTDEERAAVGWTVLNRLNSAAFGGTVREVVTAPGQYAYDQESTSEIIELTQKLLEGKISDPTGGATHFFSPISMPKEGESTTGFDTGGGLHEVPGIAKRVYFPSWTQTLIWVGDLKNVTIAYFMFYRSSSEPILTPTKKLEGIKITTEDLIEEYKTNEIAADHNYKNHILTIVSRITDISRDPSENKAYVSIEDGRVRCFFNNENELLGLAKGEEVIIKGECLGKKEDEEGTSFPILFKDCSLIDETEFQVTGWEVREGLTIKFTKFGYSVTFHLINPQGIETSTDYESLYLTEGRVSLFLTKSRYENPIPGEYKLLVKDTKENVIAIQTFNFSGPRPEIQVIDKGGWEFGGKPPEEWACYGVILKINITNSGDLPFCFREVKILFNNSSCNHELEMGIQPGEERSIFIPYGITGVWEWCPGMLCDLYFYSPGDKIVTFQFIDGTGEVVYSVNKIINVPEKPALKLEIEVIEETGRWLWLDDEQKCHYSIRLPLNIKNNGDLPFYFRHIAVKVLNDNSPEGTYDITCEVAPGEKKSIWISTWYRYDRPTIIYFCSPGKKVVTLQFINDSGEVVYSMNTTITVPEKPPVE